MNYNNTESRIALTYKDVGYTRLIIYLSVFIISYLCLRFFHQPAVTTNYENNPTHIAPAPIKLVVMIILVALSFFLSIGEILFLVRVKITNTNLEYNQASLFITRNNQETEIPLRSVNLIRSPSLINRGARGNYSRYRIQYSYNGIEDEIKISVYNRFAKDFRDFINLVKSKNPNADTRSYSEGLDSLINLFKRK